MNLLRVHKVHRPLMKGEILLVPHYIGLGGVATPVLWPPHRDEHDGQLETHYHNDERFQVDPTIKRLFPTDHSRIEWRPAAVVRSQPTYKTRTSVEYIEKGIKHLKCNALIKGRCPHKGFNMDQIILNEHGIKVCPMHGMRFGFSGKGVPYRQGELESSDPKWDGERTNTLVR